MQYATVIEKVADDQLSKVEYRYYNLNELEMVLDWIIYYERPSKRHNWRRLKGWERLSHRKSDMPREEPPQDVKDELRRRVNDALRFA